MKKLAVPGQFGWRIHREESTIWTCPPEGACCAIEGHGVAAAGSAVCGQGEGAMHMQG